MASLLLSQGVPMLLAGDECRRTQLGNNNAYCQDNEITWFNWKLVERWESLRRFCAALVAFRKAEPTVRQPDFLRGQPVRPGGLPDVSWFSSSGGQVEWSGDSRSLVCLLAALPPEGVKVGQTFLSAQRIQPDRADRNVCPTFPPRTITC